MKIAFLKHRPALALGLALGASVLVSLVATCQPAQAQYWMGPDARPSVGDAWYGFSGRRSFYGGRFIGNPSGSPVKVRQLTREAPPTNCGRLFTEVLPRGRVRCFGVDYGG